MLLNEKTTYHLTQPFQKQFHIDSAAATMCSFQYAGCSEAVHRQFAFRPLTRTHRNNNRAEYIF